MDRSDLKNRLKLILEEIQMMDNEYKKTANLKDKAWLKTRINELRGGIDNVLDTMNEKQQLQ